MNWLHAHWHAFLLALRRLTATPLNTLLSVLGIGIALALPAGGYLLLTQVATLAQGATATPQLTVFLAVDAERKTTQAVEARLKGQAGIARTQLLAREDTLLRMKASEGLADAIGALPKNPFPDAIVVTPADDAPAAIEQLATMLRQWREVEHVQVDADWARRLAAFVRLAKTGMLLLATLLGIGLFAIVFNTIRLQVLTRQAEVVVSRLLGATDGFIRRPFLWHGGLLGLASGMIAWLIVAGALLWLRLPVAELAQLYGLDLMLTLPTATQSALLLGAATLLGWLGAALSMRQHLRLME
ncbi:MAG: permease-like cell division protein FtsX [Rhodocyclaceae bacterium]|nr:permease-like cell division protein FtsX [Rhodocyclaceae bacterium]